MATIHSGGRLKLTGNHFVENGYPAYGAGGLNGFLPEYEYDRSAVILSAIGARCGKCFHVDGKWISLANTQVILPDDAVDSRFLWYQLNDELSWPRAGSGQPFIKPSDVKLREVFLPPLEDQRRIAAILDEADAIRTKRRTNALALEALIRSGFDEMFSNATWPVKNLSELAECLDSKRRPVTAKDRPDGNVPYYGANNQQGWIDSQLFNEPLVLVAEDGGWFETPERGVAYRIDGPAWVNNHAHVLRAKPELETEFLHRVLKHFDFRPYISGSTRSKLNQKQLMGVTIPLPPLALQQEFAARVQKIEEQRRLVLAALERDNELFASLQERAFSGGL